MKHRLKVLRDEDLKKLVVVVVGTRPGIVKMSPVVRALAERGIEHALIHTGQHYSHEMDRKFFEDLELQEPAFHLDRVSECYYHGGQTAEMLRGVEEALLELLPRVVLVCGDANTNLAAGLAARKLRIVVGHVESGLRSHDWRMPEEHNRIILDHVSELLFAPTESSRRNLIEDNVRGEIHVTGNTVVDAVQQNLELARGKSTILQSLGLTAEEYFLCTSHREENVDSRERLSAILAGLERVAEESSLPVIFPVHPRTRRRIEEFGLQDEISAVRVVDPVGYLDFLLLLGSARLALTDSGGIQEECCVLGIPCVTLRDNTERPETLEVGANRLAGTSPREIARAVRSMLSVKRDWANPFGDGHAGARIAEVCARVLAEGVDLYHSPTGPRWHEPERAGAGPRSAPAELGSR